MQTLWLQTHTFTHTHTRTYTHTHTHGWLINPGWSDKVLTSRHKHTHTHSHTYKQVIVCTATRADLIPQLWPPGRRETRNSARRARNGNLLLRCCYCWYTAVKFARRAKTTQSLQRPTIQARYTHAPSPSHTHTHHTTAWNFQQMFGSARAT
jgi:hypothetical protein